MSIPTIEAFIFDEVNEEKFAGHGIAADQVLQVLAHDYVTVRNRPGRRASYLVIGYDDQGRCLAVPITPTAEAGVWRPVTAWPCKDFEQLRLGKRGG